MYQYQMFQFVHHHLIATIFMDMCKLKTIDLSTLRGENTCIYLQYSRTCFEKLYNINLVHVYTIVLYTLNGHM